jgi:hypothetical protein
MDEFIGKVDDFISKIDDIQEDQQESFDVNEYSRLAKLAAWVILIGTFSTMILYLALMACSLKGKCHNFSTFFQALIAIFKMFFAIIINLVAAVSIAVSIGLINACYAMDKGLNDPDYSKRFASGQIRELLDACVFPGASGSVSGFIGDTSKFDELTGLTDTFSEGFSKFNPREGSGLTTSITLTAYDTEYFSKLKTYETSNFQTQSSEDPMSLIGDINDRSDGSGVDCNTDRISPNPARCPSGYTTTISTAISPTD